MVTEKFALNKPVTTKDPLVQVDSLSVGSGRHVFELVVVDEDGNASSMARNVVVVRGNPDGGGVVPVVPTGPVIGPIFTPAPVVGPVPVIGPVPVPGPPVGPLVGPVVGPVIGPAPVVETLISPLRAGLPSVKRPKEREEDVAGGEDAPKKAAKPSKRIRRKPSSGQSGPKPE
jgi:hypothetical protein